MKPTKISILIILLLSVPIFAERPIVSNVQSAQRETAGTLTKLVDITYDVENLDGGPVSIRLQISNNRGSTFSVPSASVSGDIGANISPGDGKKIVWDAGTDFPDEFGAEFVAKVIASNRVIENGRIIFHGDPDWSSSRVVSFDISSVTDTTNLFSTDESITNIAIRPGRDEIVYSTSSGGVFIVTLPGVISTSVAYSQNDILDIKWSRNGNFIAILSEIKVTIFTAVDLEIYSQFEITSEYDHLDWSPNGDQLILSGGYSFQNDHMRTVDVQGNLVHDFGYNGVSATWSPDGSTIALLSDGDIWFLPSEGGSQKLVMDIDFNGIIWSPDGNKLLLFEKSTYSHNNIWSINADGTNLTGLDSPAHFSPLVSAWLAK
jgi:hypothetical protein